jgi:LysR family glycine cleavage system transcriptional activator
MTKDILRRRHSGRERLEVADDVHPALADIARGLDALEGGVHCLKGPRARAVVMVTASQAPVAN